MPALSTGGDAQDPPKFQRDVEKRERDQQRVTRMRGWEAEGDHSFPREQHSPATDHAEVGNHHPWGFPPLKSCQQPCCKQEVGTETPKFLSTTPWATVCSDTGFLSTRSLHAGAKLQAGLRYGAGLSARPGEALGRFPALALQLPAVCLLQQ